MDEIKDDETMSALFHSTLSLEMVLQIYIIKWMMAKDYTPYNGVSLS